MQVGTVCLDSISSRYLWMRPGNVVLLYCQYSSIVLSDLRQSGRSRDLAVHIYVGRVQHAQVTASSMQLIAVGNNVAQLILHCSVTQC